MKIMKQHTMLYAFLLAVGLVGSLDRARLPLHPLRPRRQKK